MIRLCNSHRRFSKRSQFLVENRGHILEKDELIKQLWPDTFVEESSLAQNIFQLRRALKEGGIQPKIH